MTHAEARITADFSHRADHPLSKSTFAVFNSGLVRAETYRRDLEFLTSSRPESCRIDIGWGAEWMGYEHEAASVVDGTVAYAFGETDDVAKALKAAGVRPYWSYSYVPAPFQRADGDWRSLGDVQGWVEMVRAYAAGAHERGVDVGYHEVYNEPDLRDERTNEPVFYDGSLEDYLELYHQASLALREADPGTPIGGPALALVHPDEHWIGAFLDYVTANSLPLDFFSFHHYGTYTLGTAIDKVLERLNARPELAEVEAHLNEYNSFPIDYPRGGVQDSHFLAAALLADIGRILARPGVTKVSWAQFLDSGHDNYSGLVDIDGLPKPAFFAYSMYQNAPVDRFALHVEGQRGLGGLAASDGSRAVSLLWNRADRDVRVAVSFEGLECEPVHVQLRRIDAAHKGDSPEELEPGTQWLVEIPRGGVVQVEAFTATLAAAPLRAGQTRRVRHRYVDRSSTAWADFEEATTTFRLGSSDRPQTTPVVAAELVDVAPDLAVTASLVSPDGQPCTTGSLSLRIDTAGQAFVLHLGPERRPATGSWPSWVDPSVPVSEPGPAQMVQLPGDDRGRQSLTVTVELTGAPAGSFATVVLADGSSR